MRVGRPSSVSGGCGSIDLAKRRTVFFERSSVRYSTGDLPSMRARNSAGSRCAARCSSVAAGSQSTPRDMRRPSRRTTRAALRGGWNPQRLQQQMVEAKGQIEGGVAEPRALGIEEDRTARAKKNIFRADVAVHDRELVRAVRSASASRTAARSGCARAVASRYGSMRRAWNEASVSKSAAAVARFRERGMYGRKLPADCRRLFRGSRSRARAALSTARD